MSSVAYLGFVVSANGVATDSDKVDAVSSWLEPPSAWDVRGLLGLAGYYRNLSGTSTITTPLTRLLRKDTFAWTPEAVEAFMALKCALSTGLVLQMPDFDQQFIVDCDACGTGSAPFSTRGQSHWPSSADHSPPATTS